VMTVTNEFLDRYLKSLAAVRIVSPDRALATLTTKS